jgi:integrase
MMARQYDPAASLRALKEGGDFETLCAIAPLGSLQARKAKGGTISFAWRFSIVLAGSGKQTHSREIFGTFDRALPPKSLKPTGSTYSLAAAIRKGEELAQAHADARKQGGMLAIREAERAERDAAEAAARTDKAMTLASLMGAYGDHLEAIGRDAFRDVRSILKCHIEPHTLVAQKAARLVSPEDIADLMRRIHTGGKTRTANKARSYIRAAYETAKGARLDSTIPALFKDYGVIINPAAETRVAKAKAGARRTIRALDLEGFRTYWRIIKGIEGQRGALLRLHLLTGGQRLDQLVRLAPEDITALTITLWDGKGKPGEAARPHIVPLIAEASAALRECASLDGRYAFTSDGGETHIWGETLSGWAIDAARDALPGFTPKLIRSGVETILSSAAAKALGIDKEVRGRLQSHGIAGVQDRHYNAYEFIEEKRAALDFLFKLLTGRGGSAKVIPLSAAKPERKAA